MGNGAVGFNVYHNKAHGLSLLVVGVWVRYIFYLRMLSIFTSLGLAHASRNSVMMIILSQEG